MLCHFEFLKFLISFFVVVISTRKHSYYVYISFLMSAECNLIVNSMCNTSET